MPLVDLVKKSHWEHKEFGPSNFKGYFSGGPFVICGLTAYILDRFLTEIIAQCDVKTADGAVLNYGKIKVESAVEIDPQIKS